MADLLKPKFVSTLSSAIETDQICSALRLTDDVLISRTCCARFNIIEEVPVKGAKAVSRLCKPGKQMMRQAASYLKIPSSLPIGPNVEVETRFHEAPERLVPARALRAKTNRHRVFGWSSCKALVSLVIFFKWARSRRKRNVITVHPMRTPMRVRL